MDNWDDEDFEPKVPVVSDKWEGEDADEDLKDNWDDDEEEDKPKEPEGPKQEPKKGGKRYLAKRLKEKEEEQRLEAERRREEEAQKTPEEKMREKLLAQKLSEESDLEVTKEMFQAQAVEDEKQTLDNFKPRTKEDFNNFLKLLQEKFTTLESSPHYFYLMSNFISSAVVTLDTDQLKQLSSSINVLATEKLKQERQKKGGKKSTKAKLAGGTKGGRNDAIDDLSLYNDFDDFM
uniref:Eukaryotic translation initiation factor 3 subunit J n=1 Tax=Phallusia mammillata TaxID=59560 RepID=A0A6F9DCC5_9ASCI|nr:eukaryotic translation initiation factor 3 subunit J-A-like [Phallusia mammillata]